MSKTRRGVRCVAWFLVATTCLLGAADASARGGLEQYLPEDTFVYISANDLPSYRQKFEGTALYDIGQEPSVRRVIDGLKEQGRERAEQELGLSLEKIGSIFSGQIVFALTQLDIEAEKIGAVLVADIEPDKAETLKKLLPAIEVRLRGQMPLSEKQTSTYSGLEITMYAVDGMQVCYCFPRDKFVLSAGTSGREAMQSLLDNLASPPRASLATSPEFRAISAKIGAGSESFSFFNLEKLMDLIIKSSPNEDVPQIINALGLMGLKSAGLSSAIVDKGFRDVMYIHVPGERRGVMKLFGTRSNVTEMLRYFPENVSSVSSFTLDFAGLWQEFLSTVRQMDPAGAEDIAEVVAEFERELELSVERDIFGMFSGPIAVGMSGAPIPLPQILVAAKVREGARAEEMIGKLLSLSGAPPPTETEYSGHRIFSISMPGAPIMPSYTVYQDCLLVSISPQVLQSTLSQLTSQSRSAADNRSVKEALGHVPRPDTAFSYSDIATGFTTMYMGFMPLLHAAQEKIPINLAELPPAQDISRHLFPAVSSTTVDAEGIRSTSYGPFGGASLLGVGPTGPAAAGVGAAIMLPALGRAREAAQRASCQNNLKQMGLVFKMYANESKGEKFPVIDDKRGNLAPEGDAIFPEYLTDLNVLRCPSDPESQPIRRPQTPDEINDESYFYLGWVVTTEEEGLALLDAYESLDLTQRDEDIEVAAGKGSVGGDVIFRLREGIERFFITDINNPAGSAVMQSSIPIMWDRPGHHLPGGANVLYMDGHVEFVRYPGEFPMTVRFMERLEEVSARKAAQ